MLVFGENLAWRGRRILLMKKKRFSVEQIVGVLKQAVPVVELIRKAGITGTKDRGGQSHSCQTDPLTYTI